MTTPPSGDGLPDLERETGVCNHKWAFVQAPCVDMRDVEYRIQCMDCGEIKERVTHRTFIRQWGANTPPTLTILLNRLTTGY